VTGALALSLLLLGGPAHKEGVRWEKSFEKAQKRAQTENKPILIDFWADWCGWCHRLDETTYRDPEVVRLSIDFVPVKVNAEGSKADVAVAARYGVSSLPTVAFVSPAGRMIHRVDGFQGPAQFPGTMQEAKQKAARLMGWEAALAEDPDDPAALLGLGIHLLEESLYDESREMLARARRADAPRPVPDRKHARLLLGTLEYYAERYGEAEGVLKEGLALRPQGEYDPKLLYVLGKAYLKWGRKSEARAALRQVLDLYAETPIAQKAKETLASLDAQR
jgi:thioredoxin-like negative regulator of GroEL